MMATTHAFAGLTLATVVVAVVPEFALVVATAAVLGGLFPDVDLFCDHRKTLHFPVYYALAALVAGVVALVIGSVALVTGAIALTTPVTTAATVALAVFFLAAATHSVMDAFGGGLELKPWEATSNRAVYSHYHGRWLEPRRWVRYDGAPEDLALACVLAIPGLLVFDGLVREFVLVMLTVSVGYTIVRKPLVQVTGWVLRRTPEPILEHLPIRVLPIDEADLEQLLE